MKKGILFLLALMVILASFAFVRAQTTNPYIDPGILKAFENQTWVSVFIVPVDNSNITVAGTNEERWNLSNQRGGWFRLAEEIIISNLSDTDIRNVRKHVGSVDAEISRQGLDNLADDKRIEKVILSYGGSPSIAIEQNQTLPYVDPFILPAFENQTWVRVSVRYVGDIPVTFDNEQEMVVYYFNSSIAKSFFSYIPATEIKNIHGGLTALQPYFSAEVTEEGFYKLVNDSRVTKIYLSRTISTLGDETQKENKTNISIPENQSEIKTPEVTKPQSFFQKAVNFFKRLFGWK